jgi:hypothetical protein
MCGYIHDLISEVYIYLIKNLQRYMAMHAVVTTTSYNTFCYTRGGEIGNKLYIKWNS